MIVPLLLSLVAPTEIVIRPDQVIRRDADRFFGINVNYVRDEDANRPVARPLDGALREMGVRWIRFPGGEKSDFHLWSEPPYERPLPRSLAWYGTVAGVRMDFDAYIRHVRAVGAEPYVVVGYDTFERTGRTKAQWLESAVAWVGYAKRKGYRVRHWEIGNENWNNKTATPEEMAGIVREFSTAMKAVDPAIKVGASGNSEDWWSKFLPGASPYLDFLAVSQYTGWEWRNYAHFLSRPGLTDTADAAVRAIDKYASPSDRSRLRVIVAETNTKDYAERGWPDANDVGHALVTFATLGRLVSSPRVDSAMVWNTRWMEAENHESSPFYVLDTKNQLLPTGQAIRLWGASVLPLLVGTSDEDTFATRSGDGRTVRVLLLNRGTESRSVTLRFEGGGAYRLRRRQEWRGLTDGARESVSREIPVSSEVGELPGLSVTTLTFLRV